MNTIDYEKSKNAIISQLEEYIESHKKYVWFTAPAKLFDVEEMQLLSVKEISDFSPLKEFKNLKSVRFGTTDCPMSIKDLKGLGELKTLETLTFMCKTKIKENIEEISKLSSLKSLGLYNVIQEIPADLIKTLDNLESVSFSKQNFNSITELPSNLKKISIAIDSIDKLPNWNKVASVLKVEIGANTCQFENLNSFNCFPNIETIKLNAPKNLTDISFVKKLVNLKSIEINFAPIDSLIDFSGNKIIEEIKARGSNVTDFNTLETLPQLKTLYLEKTKLQNIDGIKYIFPALELLWIWDTKVKDLSPLTGMTSIKELDVTKFKQKSWDFISSLTGLETLDLCKTNFSNIDLLMELPKLKYLRLSGSQIDTKSDSYKALQQLLETREGGIQ